MGWLAASRSYVLLAAGWRGDLTATSPPIAGERVGFLGVGVRRGVGRRARLARRAVGWVLGVEERACQEEALLSGLVLAGDPLRHLEHFRHRPSAWSSRTKYGSESSVTLPCSSGSTVCGSSAMSEF
jgi:hypothetical protein